MKQIKVLYVEDEPFLGKIVRESLESRGYQVQMETDGMSALASFRGFGPDLCVLDIMLPKKDGLTLGREIRTLDPRVPILFLTAKSQTDDVVKGFEAGGNDYLRKPFSLEELIVRIQNLLRMTTTQDSGRVATEAVAIGRYLFIPHKYELQGGAATQKLSHREAELLKILLEHRNRSVERQDILRRVWGDDSFFNSRNLDVYITKLRNYFKEDPSVEIITLKGIGYHFSVSEGS